MESSGNSRGGLLRAGGVLSIVAGIFQINNGAVLVPFFLTQARSVSQVMPSWWWSIPLLPGFWADYWCCYNFTYGPPIWIMIVGVLFLALGVLAVVGGISAIRQKRFGLSLAGAISALGSGLLGIVAVIFVALGKREFGAKG
jgi:hypothetical protein